MGGKVTALWDQDSFRWYSDAGGEGTNPLADTNIDPADLSVETNYRLRYLIQETAGSNQAETPSFELEYRFDAAGGTSFGSWAQCDSDAAEFNAVSTASVTDGGTTTQQIGGGTFNDGEFCYVDAGGSATNAMTATAGSDEYECEWVIELASGTAGYNFEFRVTRDGGTTMNSTTNTTQVGVAAAPVTGTAVQTTPGFSQVAAGTHRENATGTAVQNLGVENRLTYSEQIDNAAWAKTRAVVSADQTTAPDGKSTADKVTDDSGGSASSSYLNRSALGTGSPPGTHTVSVYVKKDQSDYFAFRFISWVQPDGSCWFNVSNGTLGTNNIAGSTAAISDEGNGWYRCSLTFTTDETTTNGSILFHLAASDASLTVPRDGTDSLFIWGAQLNTGGVEVYVPTVASTERGAPATQTASGTQTISGAAVQTVPGLSQIASGAETISGAAVQTTPAFAQVASGTHTAPAVTGTAVQTVPSFDQVAAGTHTENVTGSAVQTVPDISQSAAGELQVSGSAVQTVPGFDQVASGIEEMSGAAAQTVPAFDQVASGESISNDAAGSAAQTVPGFDQVAAGTHQANISGTAVQTVTAFDQLATGTYTGPPTGAANQTTPPFDQLAAGEVTGVAPEVVVEYPTGLGAVSDGPDFAGDPAIVDDGDPFFTERERARNERRRRAQERLRATVRQRLADDARDTAEDPAPQDEPVELRRRTRQEQKALEAAIRGALQAEGTVVDFGAVRKAIRDVQAEISARLAEIAEDEAEVEMLLLTL